MKIEIGMYVRSNDGYIAKLVEKKQRQIYIATAHPKFDYIFDGQVWDSRCTDGYYDDHELGEEEINDSIIETSFNIIDLIKIGDYINGHKVTAIYDYPRKHFEAKTEFNLNWVTLYFYEETIEDVVTKESFERETYKVKK